MQEHFKKNRLVRQSKQLKSLNLYPFFRTIDDSDGNVVVRQGKRQVMIGSNNYLGLTHHPYVKEQAIKAIEKYGTGCTGSRFLNGNLSIHEELEAELAEFVGMDEALVFATGMQVNIGAVTALGGPRDCLICDSENHASLIDATRMAMATAFKFRHNDMNDLERVLKANAKRFRHAIIVADGVFSMTGEILDLPGVVELAKKYNAFTYIDDAHGVGVLGRQGRGVLDHFNVTKDVDMMMGTFSKSYASVGGFVAADKEAINYLRYNARSFMFSAALPPASVATAKASLHVMKTEPEIFDKLWNNVSFMKKGLTDLGFYTYNTETPIIPILVGDDMKAMQITQFLESEGVFATPVIGPAVPKGEALIRTSYMASHKKEDLQYCLDIFAKVAENFDLPSTKLLS